MPERRRGHDTRSIPGTGRCLPAPLEQPTGHAHLRVTPHHAAAAYRPSKNRSRRLIRKAVLGSVTTGAAVLPCGAQVILGWPAPRADVAQLMLALLGRPDTIHQAIGIAS
jgi:hypothetical protein